MRTAMLRRTLALAAIFLALNQLAFVIEAAFSDPFQKSSRISARDEKPLANAAKSLLTVGGVMDATGPSGIAVSLCF